MLVLSRSVNESIDLGSDIKITITAIRGGQVDVAIEAPKTVSIKRSEAQDPTEVWVPYEFKNGDQVRALGLPIFTNSKAVGQFLVNRYELRTRRLEWIEESSPEALNAWRAQFTGRRLT